jgi:hypothetical protein
MPWTIYCHTHIASGRRYVGLTKKTWKQRWNQHIYTANSVRRGYGHFPNAIRKYGKDAFSHEVLQVCETLEEANKAEKHWIEYFDTTNPERGFNLTKDSTYIPHPIRRNPWNRPEYREKMTAKIRALWNDPEFRAKISKAHRKSHDSPRVRAKMMDPKMRAKRSADSKALWDNPEFREKCTKHPLNPIPKSTPKSTKESFVPGKLCCRCHEPGLFGKDKHTKDGLKRVCKKCEKIARQSKREEIKARSKKYRESKKEESKAYQTAYYKKNRSRIQKRDKLKRREINKRVARHKEKLRGMVDEIKQLPCQACKLKKPDEIDFYRPGFKHRSIHWLIAHNSSENRVMEEINNCERLCISCYRSRVYSERLMGFHWYRFGQE